MAPGDYPGVGEHKSAINVTNVYVFTYKLSVLYFFVRRIACQQPHLLYYSIHQHRSAHHLCRYCKFDLYELYSGVTHVLCGSVVARNDIELGVFMLVGVVNGVPLSPNFKECALITPCLACSNAVRTRSKGVIWSLGGSCIGDGVVLQGEVRWYGDVASVAVGKELAKLGNDVCMDGLR